MLFSQICFHSQLQCHLATNYFVFKNEIIMKWRTWFLFYFFIFWPPAQKEKCINIKQVSNIFPLNYTEYDLETRNKVTHAMTNRLKNSTIQFMQRQLNNEKQSSVRFISRTWPSSCQLKKEKKTSPLQLVKWQHHFIEINRSISLSLTHHPPTRNF